MVKELKIENCINEKCPLTDEPVSSDALTTYRDHVVGFSQSKSKEEFEKAVLHFELSLSKIV